MARYFVGNDELASDVAADLIGQVDDPRTVVYVHDGRNGAFDIPDDLAETYMTAEAREAREKRSAEAAEARASNLAAYHITASHEPTAADLSGENSVTGTYEAEATKPAARRGRRVPASETKE